MITTSLPEQLRRAFKPGNDARTTLRKTQKIAAKFCLIGFLATVAIPAVIWGFIPEVKEARAEAQKEKRAKAVAQATIRPRVTVQNDLGTTHVLVVTDIPSDEIYLPDNRCFRAWGVDPDGGMDPDLKAVHTAVRGHNKEEWYSWEEFQKLREQKKISFEYPAWARFSAKEGTAAVHYTFYDLRSSRCPRR